MLTLLLFLIFVGAIITLSVVQGRISSQLGRRMRQSTRKEPGDNTSGDDQEVEITHKSEIPAFKVEIFEADAISSASDAAQKIIDRTHRQFDRVFWSFHSINLAMLIAYLPLMLAGARMSDSPVRGWLIFAVMTIFISMFKLKSRATATQGLAMLLGFCWTGYLLYIVIYALLAAMGMIGGERAYACLVLALTAAGLLLLRYSVRRWMWWWQLQNANSHKPERLLYLWVFGTDSVSFLTLYLGALWRMIGPTWFIRGKGQMGDDIIKAIIRLLKREKMLVSTPDDLVRELNRFDSKPHYSGAYFEKSLICNDTVWQAALNELMRRSDVVVINLCGFGPENRGCAYELCQLIDRIPTHRFLLLVSDKTDLPYLEDLLHTEWASMAPTSPNRVRKPAPIRLFQLGTSIGSNEGEDLVHSSREGDAIFRLLIEGMVTTEQQRLQ